MSSKKWTPLHHDVWRVLQSHLPNNFKDSKFLACVSGGADSIALLSILKDLPLKLEVFHAHHGPGENLLYRDQAAEYVAQFCAKENLKLNLVRSDKELKSEDDFRKFRLAYLKTYHKKNPHSIIVMAHHLDDLLETRMMRLIRGTGPIGLQSMNIWTAPVLRPFLQMDSQVLKNYLKKAKLDWREDPSNQSPQYFRNWIRHRWLPVLEKARPGSLKRLALSLENLSSLATPVLSNSAVQKSILRSHYISLNPKGQLQSLAVLLKNHGLSQYTSGQLKEVQKRLDKSRKRLTFEAAGAIWTINAERILAKPL